MSKTLCLKRSSVNATIRGKQVRVDSCLRETIEALNKRGTVTVACCCGHGRYEPTILFKSRRKIHILGSSVVVPRIRNFYRRDSKGFFYIPELERSKK